MPEICNMGQTALLPLRRKEFFALKNPTASATFEPANLGTKGQHATSRPPKPVSTQYNIVNNITKFKDQLEVESVTKSRFMRVLIQAYLRVKK
jgi:hypothetical protein